MAFGKHFYPFNDPGQLPIKPLRDAIGEWLRIPLHLPEATLWVRSWQANVGRTKLYLLDINDPANLPTHRCITSQLYGGGPELRFQQEMVLGLAGWRLLYALGIRPEVCHLNEGHAALVVLERAFSYMEEQHQPFDVALTVTRAGNLFTTHTPVEAGCDRFPPTVVRQYLERYAEHELRVEFDDLLSSAGEIGSTILSPLTWRFLPSVEAGLSTVSANFTVGSARDSSSQSFHASLKLRCPSATWRTEFTSRFQVAPARVSAR